jgi:hypothetical protein
MEKGSATVQYKPVPFSVVFGEQDQEESMKRSLSIIFIVCFLLAGTVSLSGELKSSTLSSGNSDTVKGSQHQGGDVWMEPLSGMEFVYVPAGCFHLRPPRGII